MVVLYPPFLATGAEYKANPLVPGTRIKENTECRRAGDHAPARRPCSFDRQSPAFCWISLKSATCARTFDRPSPRLRRFCDLAEHAGDVVDLCSRVPHFGIAESW